MTQQQVAERLGVNQSTINRDLCKKEVPAKKMHKPKRKHPEVRLRPGTKQDVAAKNIVKTLGIEFALSLAEEILNYH